MVMYVVLFLVLCLASAGEIYQKRNIVLEGKQHSVTLQVEVCIPLLLWLFLGIFRETSVGYDANNYYYNYWVPIDLFSWKQLLRNFSMDNGFFLVLKLISLFTEDYWVVRAVLFIVTFLPSYIVIRKHSPYLAMSLIIYLGNGMLGLTFGILRQALALTFVVLAYEQIYKHSRLKCLVLLLIATTIHKTAAVGILMPVLQILNEKKFSTVKMVLLSCLSYGIFTVAIPFLATFYGSGEYYGTTNNNGGYAKLLFIIMVIGIIVHLFRVTDAQKDGELVYLFNLSCAGLFVQIGALRWSLITRISGFFLIFWCILIPKLICRLPRQKRFSYYAVLVALFGAMFFSQVAEVEWFVMHQF